MAVELLSNDVHALEAAVCKQLGFVALGGVTAGERVCLWLPQDGKGVKYSFDGDRSASAASTAVSSEPLTPTLVNCQEKHLH